MIRARLSDGRFLLGIDAENVRRLKDGQPIVIDLRDHGGTDVFMLMYGDTLAAIMEELDEAAGPLPPAQPMPSQGKPS